MRQRELIEWRSCRFLQKKKNLFWHSIEPTYNDYHLFKTKVFSFLHETMYIKTPRTWHAIEWWKCSWSYWRRLYIVALYANKWLIEKSGQRSQQSTSVHDLILWLRVGPIARRSKTSSSSPGQRCGIAHPGRARVVASGEISLSYIIGCNAFRDFLKPFKGHQKLWNLSLIV